MFFVLDIIQATFITVAIVDLHNLPEQDTYLQSKDFKTW